MIAITVECLLLQSEKLAHQYVSLTFSTFNIQIWYRGKCVVVADIYIPHLPLCNFLFISFVISGLIISAFFFSHSHCLQFAIFAIYQKIFSLFQFTHIYFSSIFHQNSHTLVYLFLRISRCFIAPLTIYLCINQSVSTSLAWEFGAYIANGKSSSTCCCGYRYNV